MRKKKNRFLLFCCSFIPGAGELYLGFMNMGLSLMLTFAVTTVIVGFTNIGILSFIPMVIWVYGFFHANNLGALSDEEFYRMEDTYLFGFDNNEIKSIKESLSGRYRKAAAIILIILGISMLWDVVTDYIYDIVGHDFYYRYIGRYIDSINNEVPQLIISIVIIWCGVKLIRGKKVELDRIEERDEGVYGNRNGNANGNMGGNVNGSTSENVDGNVNGRMDGNTSGNTSGNMGGNSDGNANGNANGYMNEHMDNNPR